MQAAIEILALPQVFEGNPAHARHDPHAQHHVKRVGQFQADFCQGGTGRSHQIRNHIEGVSAHASGAEGMELAVHLPGRGPMIGRTGVLLGGSAYKSAILTAGHVVRFGTVIITARQFLLVELEQNPLGQRFFRQPFLFLPGPVAPDYFIRLAQRRHFLDPANDGLIGGVGRVHLVYHCHQTYRKAALKVKDCMGLIVVRALAVLRLVQSRTLLLRRHPQVGQRADKLEDDKRSRRRREPR